MSRFSVERRLRRFEAVLRPRPDPQQVAAAAARCRERVLRYFDDPSVPVEEKAQKVAYIVGMMAQTRDEATMLALLRDVLRQPDPAAALAEGKAVYARLKGGQQP